MAAIANSKTNVDSAEHRAAGVAYAGIDGAPGLFFDCQPYRAKLSTKACARRWRSAQQARGEAAERFAKCRGCSIGAAHAGEAEVHYSILFGANICPRCGRGSARRLIGGRRCISCYNREWEFVRGRNAKGTRPIKAQLARHSLRYTIEGGGVDTLTIDNSADLAELMVIALRKTRGRLFFAFNRQGPAGSAGTP